MKEEITVNPKHGDYRSWEGGIYGKLLFCIVRDLTRLDLDIEEYMEIGRAGITDEEIAADAKIEAELESKINERCNRISESALEIGLTIKGGAEIQ